MLISSLVFSLILGGSRYANCPCVVTPGEDLAQPATLVPRAYETAGVVFTGRVVGADTIAKHALRLGPDSAAAQPPVIVADTARYLVAVAEVWKGSVGQHATVQVPGAYTSCDLTLSVGASYLLYAYGKPNTLVIDACARVTTLEEARVDREVPRRPRRNQLRAPESGGG